MSAADYSLLNNPAISMNSFYPRRNWTDTPQGAEDYTIPVDDGVQLSARFFPAAKTSPAANGPGNENPTLLFFYGNGETVEDYGG